MDEKSGLLGVIAYGVAIVDVVSCLCNCCGRHKVILSVFAAEC